MSKIIVAGAGHGGLVAAIKLAKAGHEVLVFEKRKKDETGYPQSDTIEKSAFAYADIPIPENCKTVRNTITFIPMEKDVSSFTVPPGEDDSVFIDRKVLINHLINLAAEAGAQIFFETEIVAPIMLGNRVCGVKTAQQAFYADLVIDACGVYSPVRCNLPDYMCVNREIKKYDVLSSYRAYFNRIPNVPLPETTYNVYLRDSGTVGFTWLVTEEDRVDLLVARFRKPENEDILKIMQTMHEENAHMGTELIYGGCHATIPICQPLAVLVADGYAAVGDSAFMTYSIKGSGIAYCLRAGTMLAECVINDTQGFYNAEKLWAYQRRFYKEIGFSACRIAIIKNILPYVSAEQANELIKQNIISTEEISKLMAEKFDAVLNAKGMAALKEKVKLVKDNTLLKGIIANLAVWLGKFAVTETAFPAKYSLQDVRKWSTKYNEFFDSIRAK
ncbi:MAG: NAD(P)/FAD-dependent oxidoreductase [Clostridia bacterium]|nr:NAD(P)/FAD-dependent oxidoreductase [Clostridia bacterium]